MAREANNLLLPDEIIINILKRLPVKSLIRFQCVCKEWKNLFRTQSFITDHFHHSDHNKPLLILKLCRDIFNSLDIFFLTDTMEILEVHKPPLISFSSGARIVGSSNGLLCVSVKKVHAAESRHAFLIWNPATREVRYVPETINHGYEFFGFGFCPIHNDFKILRLRCHFPGASNNYFLRVRLVEVYSLSTKSWKKLEFGIIESVRHRYEIVSVNGSMFWLGVENGRMFVVSFDMAMEVFKFIPLPTLPFQQDKTTSLTLYENKLALFHYVFENKFSFIDLWVMEEGTGASGKRWSWTKKCAIGPILRKLFPLHIRKNEIIVCDLVERLIEEGGRGYGRSLYQLNLTTDEMKKLPNFADSYDHCGILNYAESLASVEELTTCTTSSLAFKLLCLHCVFTLFQHFRWK